MKLQFSFIIPVYNRPQEVKELLESFEALERTSAFEIVIIEDGSTETSQEIIASFEDILDISYFYKENTGPGASRNYGMERARGNYFIILDSDCMLPAQYLKVVNDFLSTSFFDCYGGADAAHSDFTHIQKAINYTMTSFFTTGGIRGNRKSITNFEPRSFNMGISKEAFQRTGGFSKIHPGEDPDLSQRILKAGFKTTFIPDAFVYHKRRISWSKFYVQVKKFGTVRPILNSWHPQAAKITFWLPSFFVLFVIASIILTISFHWMFLIPLALYLVLICIASAIKNRSIWVGVLSVWAVMIQFFGYGIAFLKSTILIGLLKKDPEKQFPHLFFK